jgi:hypothetical protein
MIYDTIQEKKVSNFSELVFEVENSKKPFIVRDFNLMDISWEKFKVCLSQEPEIFGYDETVNWDAKYNNGIVVLNSFLKNELKMNVVDSPITKENFLSSEWTSYAKSKLKEHYNFSSTYILTNKNKLTLYHTDPPYAGGYMYLKEGYKTWYCINPEDWNYLQSQNISRDEIIKMTDEEIEKLSNNYLVNKISKNYLSSNDFIWFPIDTLHKVTTEQKSWGIGGYL